ncbi:MAG TPA: response regulator [bacterium]|nr:response regulator [bacterium]
MPGETVLLIDDSEARLDMMSRLVRRNGFEPLQAQNGLAALTLPEDKKVALIIINTGLMQPDGEELAERLRRSSRAWYLPILLLVPSEKQHSGEQQPLFGADSFINFPCSAADLARKMDEVLRDKKARDFAEERLVEITRQHISDAVDRVAEQELSTKSAEVISDLSAGIVDLVSIEAKKTMDQKVQELVAGAFAEQVRAIVEDVARTVLAEESENIITTLVASVVDQQVGQILGKLETDELPNIARRAVEKVVEVAVKEKVAQITMETHAETVQKLVSQISEVVERTARSIIPKILGKQ